MIDYKYSDLFKKDGVRKELILDFGDFQIRNDKLYTESFELQESLCSQEELKFGTCESSVVKFKCRNEFGELTNKWFDVYIVLNGNDDEPFKIGSYRVSSDEPSGDKKQKTITAYDGMNAVINAEMVDWYNSIEFPITLKEFRYSFFEYLGLDHEEVVLANDDTLIERTLDAKSISGKQVITSICELNGVFGHIKHGVFHYVSLENKKYIIYPNEKIYPSANIYPGMLLDKEYSKINISKSDYRSCEYEDFETQFISKLQIRQEEGDIGIILGDGSNTYIVQGNFLVYGKSANELLVIGNRLLSKIIGVQYRPFKSSLRGNPCVEIGDVVSIEATYKTIESYVLERTLSGIQSLTDSFRSKGAFEYKEKVNSTKEEVVRLKGKTSRLERTVDSLLSEIYDEETGLKSEIKQTAEELSLKVNKGEVVSEINQSAEEVKIKGEKIALEGTVTANENFKILDDGSVQARNGSFEGTIKTSSAEITGGFLNIETDSSESSAVTLHWENFQGNFSPFHIMFTDSENYSYFSNNSMWFAYLEDLFIYFAQSGVQIFTDFSVSGKKSRLAKTKSYNDRLLYCYEMPSPMFGDAGHGVIGEDGLCYIDIDQIFFETIDTFQSYQVFLQSYAESNVYVIEKQQDYFVVKGSPNTEFDWEVKAKQLDFSMERLEENFAKDEYKETDYVALASEYLKQYEQEVLNYE